MNSILTFVELRATRATSLTSWPTITALWKSTRSAHAITTLPPTLRAVTIAAALLIRFKACPKQRAVVIVLRKHNPGEVRLGGSTLGRVNHYVTDGEIAVAEIAVDAVSPPAICRGHASPA